MTEIPDKTLKARYGPEVPRKIGEHIGVVFPAWKQEAFLQAALNGYDNLELMDRGRQISKALRQHLPPRFSEALDILLASLGPPLTHTHSFGMAPFHYLPHVFFVGTYGPESILSGQDADFDRCMWAQHALTQRFTAEFSMRPFLIHFPEATLKYLHRWCTDPSEHVRRLVSEGTRPRLPWAPRLPAFQKDPSPVIALLENLKNDPARYVQRSVANNLNDISKDSPASFYRTLQNWQGKCHPWIIQHALRTALKRGDPEALALSGFETGEAKNAHLVIEESKCSPETPRMGESVTVHCLLRNTGTTPQKALVNIAIDYVRASGKSSRKIFRLKTVTLSAGEGVELAKSIGLHAMTTRQHYPGKHPVSLLLNGVDYPIGFFNLLSGN